MADPLDPTNIAAEGGKVASGPLTALLLAWLFKRKDRQDDSQDAVLARIEAKLADVHTELRLQAERFTALEHQVDALKERINGGLSDHARRLENYGERLVRLETLGGTK